MRWCRLDTKLFALYIQVLVITELVVSGTQCTWKYSHYTVYCDIVSEKDISVLFSEPPPISSKSFVYKLYNAQQKPVMEVRNTSDEFQMYRNTLVIEL